MNVELDDLARLAREQEPKLSVSNSSTTGLQAYTPMLSFIYGGYEFKPWSSSISHPKSYQA